MRCIDPGPNLNQYTMEECVSSWMQVIPCSVLIVIAAKQACASAYNASCKAITNLFCSR
uniref:Uncharacterized protein n=1 Tax=Setaria italica TaxID=4555 RepID=K4AHV6_SETIT